MQFGIRNYDSDFVTTEKGFFSSKHKSRHKSLLSEHEEQIIRFCANPTRLDLFELIFIETLLVFQMIRAAEIYENTKVIIDFAVILIQFVLEIIYSLIKKLVKDKPKDVSGEIVLVIFFSSI